MEDTMRRSQATVWHSGITCTSVALLACLFLFCGYGHPIAGSPTSGNAYVVKEDVLHIYNRIQPVLPKAISRHDIKDSQGLIYGNVITGQPAPSNAQWIEITSPHGFVSARGLEREVAYKKIQGQSFIARDEAAVYLTPDLKSRKVLSLFKGEVIPVTGVYSRSGTIWYRYEFGSIAGDDIYIGVISARVGWIIAQDVLQLDPNLDQGSLQSSEISKRVRGEAKIYSDDERSLLAKRGFYSQKVDQIPLRFVVDDMADLYQQWHGPVFLTSDLYLHTFHLLFDRMLQDVEAKRLLPGLSRLTTSMYQASEKRYASATAESIRTAAKRNMWFFGVAARLINPRFTVSPIVAKDVEKEIGKILDTKAKLPSADNPSAQHEYLPGFREDYTQYIPRGHYTLKKDLQDYFRVMMHYGRKSFMLKDASCTLSAVLMTQDLQESRLFKDWNDLSRVIDHLVGKPDDPSPKEYAAIIEKVYGTTASERNFSDSQKIKLLIELAKKELSPPRIVSQQTVERSDKQAKTQAQRVEETTGFRFFGQRHTLDAELFQRLTSPNVGSDANPKNLPSGLEVMALLSSKEAKELIPGSWWKSVENYPQEFQKAKSMVDSYPGSAWEVSAYMGWLRTLRSLFLPPESKQFFIRSGAWGYKSLNSAMGSWTELKHDTILYSKQSYAEMGEGAEDASYPPASYAPPSIKGYVEPVPAFFSRLGNLNGKTLQLLEQTGYLPNEYKDKLTTFGKLTAKAGEIARKEVGGQRITEDDYSWIRGMSNHLNQRFLLPEGISDTIEDKYLQMALIADVATDAFSGQVLVEAVGRPDELHVMVKDYWGGNRIAKGFIYTQYEFKDARRWTDDEWKQRVYSAAAQSALTTKEHPWYAKFRKQPPRPR
jgi:hypothetical protein